MWLADIEVSATAKPLRRLAKFHGDEITSLSTSPVGYYIATTSLDGWLHVYDVAAKKLIFTHNFNAPITSSVWLPLNVRTMWGFIVSKRKTCRRFGLKSLTTSNFAGRPPGSFVKANRRLIGR